MCGLVGVISNFKAGFTRAEVEAFVALLYVDALRGDDATGVLLVDKERNMTVLKEASESADFLRDKEAHSLITQAGLDGRVLLGHNRKKTIGQNRDEDAHPFVVDNNSVFFHNGTLTNHRKLADVDVDSNALAIHLAAAGGDSKTIESLLGDVNGAYACVWYDQGLNKVFFIRNSERPLVIAKLKNNGIMYASEPWMIVGAAGRNRLDIESWEACKEHTLYSVCLDDAPLEIKKEELTVKKAMPSLHGTGMGRGGKANTATKQSFYNTKGGHLSHNQAKKIVKELEGSYVSVWADEAFQGPNGMITVVGENEDFPNVVFRAPFTRTLVYAEEEILDKLIHGDVAYAYHDKINRVVVCGLNPDPAVSRPSLTKVKSKNAEIPPNVH